MANVLEVKENLTFGKYVTAKCDIDVGRLVLASKPFASIQYLKCTGSGCFNCGVEKNTKIRCQHCIDVHFCSEACSLNEIHRTQCNSLFSTADCEEVRLVTEIIRVALSRVPEAKPFLEFCRDILRSKETPQNDQPPYSQYAEILQLKAKPESEYVSVARRAVQCVKLSQDDLDDPFRAHSHPYGISSCHLHSTEFVYRRNHCQPRWNLYKVFNLRYIISFQSLLLSKYTSLHR